MEVTALITALFSLPKVHIKENAKKDISKKLQNLLDGGPEKLQLIVDFDHTLTKCYDERTRTESSWTILSKSPLMPEVHDFFSHWPTRPQLNRWSLVLHMLSVPIFKKQNAKIYPKAK